MLQFLKNKSLYPLFGTMFLQLKISHTKMLNTIISESIYKIKSIYIFSSLKLKIGIYEYYLNKTVIVKCYVWVKKVMKNFFL